MLVQLAAADGGLPASDGGISTTADPLRFTEAWDWFRDRAPMRRDEWGRLDAAARRRAFMVSGVAALDVIDQVWRAIDDAIREGISFADFQRQTRDSLEAQWGGSRPGRVETIFRTNVQSAYSAGRWQQMTDPDVVSIRPYLEFVAVLDQTTTPICRPLEGVVRPTADGFWATHTPPLHFNCRSSLMTLTRRQAGTRAIESVPPHENATRGFGGTPDLAAWTPRQSNYDTGLWNAWTRWTERRHTAAPSTGSSAP